MGTGIVSVSATKNKPSRVWAGMRIPWEVLEAEEYSPIRSWSGVSLMDLESSGLVLFFCLCSPASLHVQETSKTIECWDLYEKGCRVPAMAGGQSSVWPCFCGQVKWGLIPLLSFRVRHSRSGDTCSGVVTNGGPEKGSMLKDFLFFILNPIQAGPRTFIDIQHKGI